MLSDVILRRIMFVIQSAKPILKVPIDWLRIKNFLSRIVKLKSLYFNCAQEFQYTSKDVKIYGNFVRSYN